MLINKHAPVHYSIEGHFQADEKGINKFEFRVFLLPQTKLHKKYFVMDLKKTIFLFKYVNILLFLCFIAFYI